MREEIKQEVRDVVDGYFRTDRPILLHRLRDEQLFADIDRAMQDLLSYTHRRAARAGYLSTLAKLEKAWGVLELRTIRLFGDLTGGEIPDQTPLEQAILGTLKQLCPSAAVCYEQAVSDLADERRLSWRSTAAELREALRELLDKLAPDEDVQRTPGFKFEDGAKGPTMKQKVRFILKSRQRPEAARKSAEGAVEVVEDKFGLFVRSVYSRSSGSVHVHADRGEIISLKRFVDAALAELLELSDV